MAIKRIPKFQQVIVIKCKKCQKWQGISTTRTQEQLHDDQEQKSLKRRKRVCTFCQQGGELITNFHIKGICSNQEAIQIIQQENRKTATNSQNFSLEFQ